MEIRNISTAPNLLHNILVLHQLDYHHPVSKCVLCSHLLSLSLFLVLLKLEIKKIGKKEDFWFVLLQAESKQLIFWFWLFFFFFFLQYYLVWDQALQFQWNTFMLIKFLHKLKQRKMSFLKFLNLQIVKRDEFLIYLWALFKLTANI